jgi:septal ring factor EnvC (AmiA/AmiB activator)
MTAAVYTTLGGVAIAAIALIYSALKDMRQGANEDGKTSAILKSVNDKLGKLDEKMTRNDSRIESIMERVIAVEQSAKQAHHRIDELRDEIHSK